MVRLLAEEKLVAVAAPREFAKSTIFEIVDTLYELYLERFHYQIFFGDTAGQAQDSLAGVVYEIETNQKLAEDYGLLKPEEPVRWSDSTIITTTNVRIDAMGVGSKVRGRRHLQWRPDRMKFDDIESDENVATAEQRKKLSNWFFKAAIPGLDKERGRARVVGTIQHYDSLLANLTDPKKNMMWAKRVYRALSYDAAGNPVSLWPERWSLADLAEKRELVGSVIFEQEMNNRPVAENEAIVKRGWIRWHKGYTPEEAKDWVKVIRIDPAAKGKEQNDEFALCVAGMDKENNLHQLDGYHAHTDFSGNLKLTFSYAEKWSAGKPENIEIHVEENAYQVALKQDVERVAKESGHYWTVKGKSTSTDKTLRLKGQSGIIESGYVDFDPSTGPDLVDQLCDWGATRYDDYADAFIGAVEGIRVVKPGFLQYLKDQAVKAREQPQQSFLQRYAGQLPH